MVLDGALRLEAEVPQRHLVVRDGNQLGLRDGAGRTEDLGSLAWLHATSRAGWVWSTADHGDVLQAVIDAQRVEFRAEGITEWHQSGSFSPDGRWFALGAYVDVRKPHRTPTQSQAEPSAPRMSVMTITEIAVDTKTTSVLDGTYPEFAGSQRGHAIRAGWSSTPRSRVGASSALGPTATSCTSGSSQ